MAAFEVTPVEFESAAAAEALAEEVPAAAATAEVDGLLASMSEGAISFAEMAAANLFAVDAEELRDDVFALERSIAEAADDVDNLWAAALVPAEATSAPLSESARQAPVAESESSSVMAAEIPPAADAPVVAAPVEGQHDRTTAPVAPAPAAPVSAPVPAAAAPGPVAAAPFFPRPDVPAPPAQTPPAASPAASVPAPAAASPAFDMPDRYDSPPMPTAWSTPAPPRFDSHPHESMRYGAPEPQPVLPGLASELDAIEREAAADSLPAVVLSLTRDGARGSGGSSRGNARPGGIERLLRLAAARGASALYLTTQARPAVRVDGDIRLLDGEAALSSGDVEAAVLELAPEGARDKESAEWIRDLADVGRVRITTFRDYRGPGALLRMIQARATSAEQLGLVREIQSLATEPEGLVIVTGPRASGKSTLVSAFVDLINRQRNDYVITLEGQIRLVHESRGSLDQPARAARQRRRSGHGSPGGAA